MAIVCISRDEVADLDDDNGNLAGILSDAVRTKADNPRDPPHKLKLKVGDVCFLTHTLDRNVGAVHNARYVNHPHMHNLIS